MAISDSAGFSAAWGVFPFLPSGALLVSDSDTGLYVLRDRTRESPTGRLGFSAPHYGGSEGETVVVEVERTDGGLGAVSVDYSASGVLPDASDLAFVKGALTWANGDAMPRTIEIPRSHR